MNKTDKNSLASLKEGNVEEFNTIFRNYYNNVNCFLRDLLKSDADAERLTQEVFVVLWKERRTIAPEMDISVCLFEIIYALSKNYLKKW